jgi:hypothetical protein
MSRDIHKLTPSMRAKYVVFDASMKAAGIPYIVTSVDRTILEQMALYVTGRLPLDQVNGFRLVAGMGVIKEDDNNKVTWTLHSKHVTNMFDEDLDNDDSRAFDIAILKDGKPTWDLKVSVNPNEIPDYEEAGKIGENCGLKWGGHFKDYCHFEEP